MPGFTATSLMHESVQSEERSKNPQPVAQLGSASQASNTSVASSLSILSIPKQGADILKQLGPAKKGRARGVLILQLAPRSRDGSSCHRNECTQRIRPGEYRFWLEVGTNKKYFHVKCLEILLPLYRRDVVCCIFPETRIHLDSNYVLDNAALPAFVEWKSRHKERARYAAVYVNDIETPVSFDSAVSPKFTNEKVTKDKGKQKGKRISEDVESIRTKKARTIASAEATAPEKGGQASVKAMSGTEDMTAEEEEKYRHELSGILGALDPKKKQLPTMVVDVDRLLVSGKGVGGVRRHFNFTL